MRWDIFKETREVLKEMGGKGSGHWRHRGRKGKKGGSAPGKAGVPTSKELSNEEREAIGFYTGQVSINQRLREGKDIGTFYTTTKEISGSELLGHIDSAIAKSPLSEDKVLYRGIPGRAAVVPRGLDVGETFVMDPAYISTSHSRKTAWMFGWEHTRSGEGMNFVTIKMKKGQRALPTGKYSEHGAEGEFLLSRGIGFKLLNFRYDEKADVSHYEVEVVE